MLTTSAMTSSSTTPSISLDFSRHSRVIVSFFFLSLSAWSRRRGGLLEVLVGDGLFLLLVEPLDLLVELLQVGRPGHRLEADAGAGLVDDVDRLVRQAAAGDVAVGQLDGGLERLVGDLHAVVRLVAVAQAREDLDRLVLASAGSTMIVWNRRSRARVLLDVLAVLVERGGADALDLAAGQGRLEHVARRRSPLRRRRRRRACAARR